MILPLNLGENSYDIVVERGSLKKIGSYLNLDRKVLILTDSGVPDEYSKMVKDASKEAYIYTIPQGEGSKSFDSYKAILSFMVEKSFTRTDCLVSVGGGVCGDLGGFVASTYMRGIDFYNIPTTLLSQLDSSIGGKVAIDLGGVKNIVGAFYQPKKVIIDSNTLKTLDVRQKMAGLCEGIKMAVSMNKALFEKIEASANLDSDIDEIIIESLKLKKNVVEIDPHERGLRRVLNYGHTIGHAIESNEELGKLLHGECVALGMLPLCSQNVYARLKSVLEKYNLPTKYDTDPDILISYIKKDKKASGDFVTIVYVDKIGEFEFKKLKIDEMKKYIDGGIL